MTRRDVSLALALCAAPASLAAQAQVTFNLADSVLAVPVTKTGSVELDLYTNCDGVGSYSITLFVDRARVHLVRADSVPVYGLPAPAIDSSVADQYTLTGGPGSAAYCTQPLALLTFDVGTTAGSGSLVSARVNSAVGLSPAVDITAGYRTGVLDVCQADKVSGDVDQNLTVNSRDALIALTAAVGLPVSGPFDLTVGDVDGDRQVTSRDALFILTVGIGLAEPYGVTAGKGIAARCAPLAPAPDSLLFFRAGALYGVAKGDTLLTALALALAPYPYYPPRWSPDGTRILYTASTSLYGNTVVAADSTGTVVDTLVRNAGGWAVGADWAPDGSRIAYVSGSVSPTSVFVANADGTNQTQVTANITVDIDQDVAWSPDGARIAFVACQTCGSYGLWVVNLDGTGLTEVVPGATAQAPGQPQWTVGSDSLYYYAANRSMVRVASVVAGDTGRVAVHLLGNTFDPAQSQAGRGFRSTIRYPYDFFLERASDTRYLRLVRGDAASTDGYFAFRRTGVAYVNTVTISPTSATLSAAAPTTFTATVTNSDALVNNAAVVTWISRNTSVAIVASTGTRTANATAVATGSTYIVVTVGGWRSDSALVSVP